MTRKHSLVLAPMLLSAVVACTSTAPVATAPAAQPAISSSTSDPVALCAQNTNLASLNGVLWQQTSVEYRAVVLQTYRTAQRMLDQALADPTWTALPDVPAKPSSLPPAIALDLDETALDNSSYQARLVRQGNRHDDDAFKRFEAEGISRAMPGARDFLQYAASRGVKVFYITNRLNVEAGRRNLERLGFPIASDEDVLLFKGSRKEWSTSDKTARRDYVAKRYRILLLLGDDFNDFVFAKGKTVAERDALFEKYKDFFGTKWFARPNPEYGSFEAAITGGGKVNPLPDCQAKINALRTDQESVAPAGQ